MTRFFFDFRVSDALSRDDEGADLSDVQQAHDEALSALGDAISDMGMEARAGQHFGIEVRDEIGPVLDVTAVLSSRILRKQ